MKFIVNGANAVGSFEKMRSPVPLKKAMPPGSVKSGVPFLNDARRIFFCMAVHMSYFHDFACLHVLDVGLRFRVGRRDLCK